MKVDVKLESEGAVEQLAAAATHHHAPHERALKAQTHTPLPPLVSFRR